MRVQSNTRREIHLSKQSKKALLAAIGCMALSSSLFADTATTLFFDNNGATAGLGSGTATWSNLGTDNHWATSTAGTTVGPWLPGSVAAINTGTLQVSNVISLSGLVFNTGAVGGNNPEITVAGAGPWALDFGSNPFTIRTNAGKEIIAVPIRGSGDMTISQTVTGTGTPIDLAGLMTGFTGNIFVNNDAASPSAANATTLQLDAPTGDATKTIYLDQFTQLANNNQVVGAGTAGDPLTNTQATPSIYTIANPIVLNYKGVVNNTTNMLSSSNGPTVASVNYSKIVTYSGVISSNPGTGTLLNQITTNLRIDGPRGTTVISGANTYNGSTIVHSGNNNGLFVLGADNTLPSTTDLIMGINNADIIGPTDLSGHNQTIRSLATNSTNTSATGIGNIYNLGVNYTGASISYTTNVTNAPASITLTPLATTSTTYKGDIGDTNLASNPFNDNLPYQGHTTANTNISLTLNGPSGGGTNTLTMAPIAALTNGNEYTGTTTVNSGAALVLGRVTAASPGNGYTVTGSGAVTINSGGTLASVATGTTSYAGGFGGNIELKGGSALTVGGAGSTGILSSNSLTIDAGANLNFDFGSNSTLFDFLNLNGGLTIDSTANSKLNLGMATGASFITPGTYSLITASGISASGSGTGSLLFANSSTDEILNGENIHLQYVGNSVQVVVTASAVQWDPNGDGASKIASSQKPSENGGVWTDGASTFVNYSSNPATEYTWSNADAKDVIIGNDATQAGGDITLGSDITAGKVTFGPIFSGFNYRIADNGSGHTLTINGGVSVNNAAATSSTPSAEIDVPITLGADQSWNVDSGQFLDVKGVLSGAGKTMTKVGPGVVDFEAAGGALGTLNANSGIVLLGATDALGNATLNLNGGGVQFAVTGTANNPINVGATGGSLGATTGFTVTIPQNITTTTNVLSVIGTGTTILSGNLSTATLSTAMGGSGVLQLTGTNNIGTLASGGGTVKLAGTDTVAMIAQRAGTSELDNSADVITSISITGGTTVLATDPTNVGTFIIGGGGTLQIGAGTTSGSLGAFSFTTTNVGTSAGQGTLAFNRSDTFTFNNLIFGGAGSLSVQQSGPGTTIITNTSNSYTGGTQVNNGTLMLGGNGVLGSGGTFQLNGANNMAVFDLNGFNQTVQGLRDGANVNFSNELITNSSATPSTLTINNSGAASYSGSFSGALTVLHSGGGTETLGGNISATVTNSGAGGLVLTNTSNLIGNLTNTAGGPVVGGGTITGNVTNGDGGTMSITGVITGSSNVANNGSSTLSLSGNNDFTGSVTVQAGTLSAGTWNPLGTSGPLGNPSAANATIIFGRSGTTGILDYEGSDTFTFARPMMAVAGGVAGLRINVPTASVTLPDSTLFGPGGFEKLGGGTVTLVGVQQLHGPITLIRGNLNIDTVADIGQPSAFGFGDTDANSAIITMGDGSGNASTISFNSATPQSTNRPFKENQNGGGFNIMSGDASAPGTVPTSSLTLTGGMDLSNSVSTTGGTVVFGGAGTVIVSTNPISGAGGRVFVGISTTADPSLVGTGTLILAGNNTYGGGTTLRNGTLKITSDSNLGAAGTSVTFAGTGTEAATLLLVGTTTLNRPIVFNQASTAIATLNFGASNITVGPISGSSTFNKTDSGITSTPSVRINGLNIAAGTVSIIGPHSSSSTSVINTLTIAGAPGGWNSSLDLGANDLVVDYTAGNSPFATVQDQIKSGRNGGNWTGNGITSSAAAAAAASGHPTALGYAEASALLGPGGGTFDGLTVDSTAVLVRYTLSGDANLDGNVNALDFNAVATNFGTNPGSQVWSSGDFNFDGTVSTGDFTALAMNFGTTPITGAPVLGALVPEPTSIGLVTLLGICTARRRRKSL